MATTESGQGTAHIQGPLWGARPHAWAQQEERQRGIYEAALRHVPVGGRDVLDVGCATGYFCRLAVDAGARASGVDAAEPLVDIARQRVPEGDFRLGDLQFLPFADDMFDVVTAFNSIQYAADPGSALAELKRVARPGALIFVLVWGRPERTELVAVLSALRPLLPPAPPGAPGPFALSAPGTLDDLVARSGLRPTASGYLEAALDYPDQQSLLAANLASGPATLAIRTSGEDVVRSAIQDAVAPYRTARGGYHLDTEWRYVIATA